MEEPTRKYDVNYNFVERKTKIVPFSPARLSDLRKVQEDPEPIKKQTSTTSTQ